MPKQIEKQVPTTKIVYMYACETCEKQYEVSYGAEQCEAQHRIGNLVMSVSPGGEECLFFRDMEDAKAYATANYAYYSGWKNTSFIPGWYFPSIGEDYEDNPTLYLTPARTQLQEWENENERRRLDIAYFRAALAISGEAK